MTADHGVDFFEQQFRRQVARQDYALNPFEQVALPFVRGRVLDLGCGLGNLCIEAARRGADVLAVDGSPTAIERIRAVAKAEKLAIDAVLADIGTYTIAGQFDSIVAIGLLMFFPRRGAHALLARIQRHVASGGVALVNTLIEGTTYLDMFEPERYYLFGRNELAQQFRGWDLLLSTHQGFDAPGGTRKEFATLAARKP
ncbi:MAG TPA: methyltransferase domain-containing protein [Burkholderiales bacterium]|nr:methyltransferase domain-containing protein [Burkholderiales bacterium]